MELALKSDSLTNILKKNQAYISSIQKVLTGKLDYAKFNKDSILAVAVDSIPKTDLSPSEAELVLRAEVEKENKKAQESAEPKKKKK